MTSQRYLYYSSWCIVDGAVIASGLAYAGKDSKTGVEKFNKIYGIKISGVELELSPQIMMTVSCTCSLEIIALEPPNPHLAEALRLQQDTGPGTEAGPVQQPRDLRGVGLLARVLPLLLRDVLLLRAAGRALQRHLPQPRLLPLHPLPH